MSANQPHHRVGQSVDTVDQLSSVVLLAIALVGAVLVVGVELLIS